MILSSYFGQRFSWPIRRKMTTHVPTSAPTPKAWVMFVAGAVSALTVEFVAIAILIAANSWQAGPIVLPFPVFPREATQTPSPSPTATRTPTPTLTPTPTVTPTATVTPTPTPDFWKLLADATNQNFWEEKYKIEGVSRQWIWPVLTGENSEVIREINGQPVVIKGRLGVLPNPYQEDKVMEVLIPYRFEWGNGLFSEEWIFENNVNKGVDYFLQLPSGEQVFVSVTIDSFHRPSECTFGTKCGWSYDISDLSADFFLNGITDEPVIVSPVTIESSVIR